MDQQPIPAPVPLLAVDVSMQCVNAAAVTPPQLITSNPGYTFSSPMEITPHPDDRKKTNLSLKRVKAERSNHLADMRQELRVLHLQYEAASREAMMQEQPDRTINPNHPVCRKLLTDGAKTTDTPVPSTSTQQDIHVKSAFPPAAKPVGDQKQASGPPGFSHPDAKAIAEYERMRACERPTAVPKDVCAFARKIVKSIARIRALDKIQYLYNPLLLRDIVRKLPVVLRYRWFDFAHDQQAEEPELLMMARFLQRQADLCSRYIDL